MIGLSGKKFSAFYRAIHGSDPYPWQKRLGESVGESGLWPQVVDIPPNSGKGGLLDIAVFGLAANPGVSPRRIVFVTTRRVAASGLCRRAMRIRDALTGYR